MSFDAIAAAVEATGLRIVGWLHPALGDGVPQGIATLFLLGPADAAMWQAFNAAPEFLDGCPDPLDRWSRRVIEGLASGFGGAAFFPFGGPPWHPFQRWAAHGEGAVVSPVAMQAAPGRGLWASYRGALGFAQRIALPPRSLANPCSGCPAPCLAACPVDAFAGGAYDVPRCVGHVIGAGEACRGGCLVRVSCPAGAGTELPSAQRAFHMAAFLAAQGAPALSPERQENCGQMSAEIDESLHSGRESHMRKVILLRHAKSSWDDPATDDHDRPLNKRGKASAPLIGRWLAERRHVPDTVLCSSSERTKETVKRIRKVLPRLPEPVVERALYHASPDQMRDRLARLPADCRTVMLVGHNPGLGSLVRKMSDGHEKRRCRRAYEHFPTGAAAVLELDLDSWSDIDFAKARFVDFAAPRELMEA